jgi:hypothetical protein
MEADYFASDLVRQLKPARTQISLYGSPAGMAAFVPSRHRKLPSLETG